MDTRAHRRLVLIGLASIAVVALVSVTAMLVLGTGHRPAVPPKQNATTLQQPRTDSLPPSLDCAFHDFTRGRVIVSFYFDVALPKDETPRFHERAIVAADGTRTNFEGDDRPSWSYGHDDDGQQVITSPDGATRIVLYGMKLGAPGISTIEAGVRSNEYRNLGGECRQTNLRADSP